MKPITTYKEHKEKPYEQVQGLGRALAYGGLDYIFNLLKNDEIYSEELEDGIIGIEAYVNEREKEIERLKQMKLHTEKYASEMEDKYILEKNKNNKAIEYIEENKTCFEDNLYCFDNMLEDVTPLLDILKGVDKE